MTFKVKGSIPLASRSLTIAESDLFDCFDVEMNPCAESNSSNESKFKDVFFTFSEVCLAKKCQISI